MNVRSKEIRVILSAHPGFAAGDGDRRAMVKSSAGLDDRDDEPWLLIPWPASTCDSKYDQLIARGAPWSPSMNVLNRTHAGGDRHV